MHGERPAPYVFTMLFNEQFRQPLDFRVCAELVEHQPFPVIAENQLERATFCEESGDGARGVNGAARTRDAPDDPARAHARTATIVAARYSMPTQPLRSNARFTCDRSFAF